jgi:micrococcal nuclease
MNSALPRKFRRSYRRLIAILALLLIVAVLRWWYSSGDHRRPDALAEGAYQVERVVDGDTLLLTNGARVRLLGIDTPETVQPNHPVEPWGPEASEFTKRAITDHASQIRLQFDRERQDRYQRFLAYVWIEDRLLNEELVRRGFATAELQYNYSPAMKRRFKRAEEAAQAAGVGIWSE